MRISAPSRLVALTATTLLAMTPATGPAAASPTTIGQAAASPTDAVYCGPTFFMQDSDTGSPTYTASAGVITAFSVMAGTAALHGDGTLALKVASKTATDTWTVRGSSAMQTLTPQQLNTFATRVPVAAGQRLGLWLSSNASCLFTTGQSGDTVTFVAGLASEPGVGTSVTMDHTEHGERLDVVASIEPDADGDGYGDLTQDLCPTRADHHGECVPPDTTATAKTKVFTTKRKAKVKVGFTSTEAGSTFVCTADGKVKACGGAGVKLRLRLGKHRITVAAVDPSGNVDPTPAMVTIKVRPRR